MITLYNFGRAFGLLDPSPFVSKAELLLLIADLPYELNSKGWGKAPKGKLPYINDDGQIVTDSTFIRFHIESKYGIDFDQQLSGERRAVLWAAERMCEEHLYFGAMYFRWLDDHNFDVGMAQFFKRAPAVVRPAIVYMARRRVKNILRTQGMGRHSVADIGRLCAADIGVLASLLGDRPYFGGDTPCGADATFGAFLMGALCPLFTSPLRDEAESHANLVAYVNRLKSRYCPDLDNV